MFKEKEKENFPESGEKLALLDLAILLLIVSFWVISGQ